MQNLILETGAVTLPIIFLIGLGIILRRVQLVTHGGLDQIKKLIINVALPSVLFSSFLTVEFELSYLSLMVYVLLVCFALFGAGFLFFRLGAGRSYTPYLTTGFEFGMIGITLFGTAYGMDQIGIIGVVGIPHELFIWFFYATLLTAKGGVKRSAGEVLRGFATTPIILAIVSGILLNLAGVGPWFSRSLFPSAILEAMGYLGGMIIPLILITVGYGMKIDRSEIGEALPTVLFRLAVVLFIALVINPVVVRLAELPEIFRHALFTFLILPPPYIVPLYIKRTETKDLVFSNNVLSLYTILSIVVFLIYVALTMGS